MFHGPIHPTYMLYHECARFRTLLLHDMYEQSVPRDLDEEMACRCRDRHNRYQGLPTRTYNLVSRKQLPLVEYACCVGTYPAAQFQPSTSTPRTKRLSAHFSIGIMAAEDVVSVIAGDANFPDTDLYHHQPCKHKATSQKLGECDQNPVNYSKLA